jgi:hypothetical protein
VCVRASCVRARLCEIIVDQSWFRLTGKLGGTEIEWGMWSISAAR